MQIIENEEKETQEKQKEETEKRLQKFVNDYVKSNAQYGHKPKDWNPKMAPYIAEEKAGYHIIDLLRSSKLLRVASNFLKGQAEKSSTFLFVGTTKVASPLIRKYALEIGGHYVNYRWLGGMLTNWPTLQKRIQRLKVLQDFEFTDSKLTISKKDYSVQRKEREKLEKLFGGIQNMKKLPDVVIFTNQLKDILAIQECMKLGIPCICLVDTNCDPDLIPYPIPANDDSPASIEFILSNLIAAIQAGYNKEKV